MRPRSYLLLAAVTVALAVGFAAVLVSNLGDGYGSRVRIRQMEQVVPGMTRAEVEALLGGPPGDYCSDPERFRIDHHSLTQIPLGFDIKEWCQLKQEVWRGDEAFVEVRFGADGRVVYRCIREAVDTRPYLHRRVVSWLRSQCHPTR